MSISIPQIGLGTWQITDRDVMKTILKGAWEEGYRLIDTAAVYSNEMAIGKAIEAEAIPRSELILSDKVWNTNRGYEEVQEACKKSLKKLKTDYLDIYLIHWPASMAVHEDWAVINAETWRGMEKLQKEGLVRTIGVSNFTINYLEKLKETAVVFPEVNQFECHPGMPQTELVEYCQKHNMVVEASSPLGSGMLTGESEELKLLAQIGTKYGKSAAQVCLRWSVQKGIVVIPKTSNVSRLKQNKDIFDFELSDEEMNKIDSIPYSGGIGFDPETITEFD